jgi:hypothetical protein
VKRRDVPARGGIDSDCRGFYRRRDFRDAALKFETCPSMHGT